MLAAYLAVLHFRHLIDGSQTTLFVDQKLLVSSLKNPNLCKLDRQKRHMSVINELVSDVEFIKGKDNVVADCMSRVTVNAIQLDSFDLSSIADAQNCPEIVEFLPRLKKYKLNRDKEILCDNDSFAPRPFVPVSCRQSVFDDLHNVSHPGIKATQRLIKSRFFYPDMDKDIRNRAKSCLICQQSKIQRHVKSEIRPFVLPVSDRFNYVHLDLVGPLPPAFDVSLPLAPPYRYLLTMIDRATRWIEAVPLVEMTAANVARAFIESWVSRFGVPLIIMTDQGRQFESELFQHLSSILGFSRLRTSAYRPCANGFLERSHRTLKSILIARKQDWFSSLPIALMSLRSHPNSDTNCSPFTFVTGTTMNMPNVSFTPTRIDNPDVYIRELASRLQSVDFSTVALGNQHSNSKPLYLPPELRYCTHAVSYTHLTLPTTPYV